MAALYPDEHRDVPLLIVTGLGDMQMKPSAQSQAVLDNLLAGRTVSSADSSVSLGPLSAPASVLLRVLIPHCEDLDNRSGEDQITALREEYLRERDVAEESKGKAANGSEAGPTAVPEERDHSQAVAPAWRVISLRCSSIRGVAPPGEEFAFDLDGESALLFGPNGSGKSSLLSVVCWVLTGKALTDSPEDVEMAPLYTVPTSGSKGSRFRDWPVAVTLPDAAEWRDATPTCWGEVVLRDCTGIRELRLRRSFGAGLESKEGDSSWEPCERLSDFSIRPLDIQLSLTAPTVFGRQAIETAKDTRGILSLMLGYDDLEKVGALCTKMSGNRTRIANKLQDQIEERWTQLRQDLSSEVERLPDGTAGKSGLRALADKASPSIEDIQDFDRQLGVAIDEAEASVASVLGLETTEGNPPEGLADKLTVAVSRLEVGQSELLPSLGALCLVSALPEVAPENHEVHLNEVERGLESYVAQAKHRIQRRWEWWKKENAPGSKAALLLKAAEFYDPEAATCPVCERDGMAELPVAEQLVSLKEVDPELGKELRTFFADLQTELLSLAPEGFKGLGAQLPKQRLKNDWQNLKDGVLDGPLEPLAAKTEKWIEEFSESLDGALPECPALVPGGADEAFKSAARGFLSDMTLAVGSLANLRWSLGAMGLVEAELRKHITDDASAEDSLVARLAKGKSAAAQVRPLTMLRDGLRGILTVRKGISDSKKTLAVLEELRDALDEIKPLSKYAAAQVSGIFGSIRSEALKHWGRMYPERSTGMKPGRLVLGSGRDKSVEAWLSREAYEVPGQHFANAGLQRAIALAFYFALLDRHPKGLGFILLDDPILSLDDDHRERWSQDVLEPRIDEFQVILATHQRQYFNYCGHHFREERIYELNPRDHAQRISIRPGHDLGRAEAALSGAWRTAWNIMRQYRDRLFETLDRYSGSAEPFFNTSSFKDSFEKYKSLKPPHPLAGKNHDRIVNIFCDPKVGHLLDEGSHPSTEASLTEPMVRTCLEELRKCDKVFQRELRRLETLRTRSRRTVEVPVALVAFPEPTEGAKWAPFGVPVIGRAAARSDPWVVDVAEDTFNAAVNAGALVLVTGESLDPVARIGQWVMLATDDVIPADGDLVAVVDEEGNRLLRRLSSDGDTWILQSINPTKPISCRLSAMVLLATRKVVGVVYLGNGSSPPAPAGALCEWAPVEAAPTDKLNSLRVIAVEGNSLDPIAKKGQWVLVTESLADVREVQQGALAAVVTDDESIGSVLKRVYVQDEVVTLVSPNPVDPTAPAVLPVASVKEVWPFAGVLFEGLEAGQ